MEHSFKYKIEKTTSSVSPYLAFDSQSPRLESVETSENK